MTEGRLSEIQLAFEQRINEALTTFAPLHAMAADVATLKKENAELRKEVAELRKPKPLPKAVGFDVNVEGRDKEGRLTKLELVPKTGTSTI